MREQSRKSKARRSTIESGFKVTEPSKQHHAAPMPQIYAQHYDNPNHKKLQKKTLAMTNLENTMKKHCTK